MQSKKFRADINGLRAIAVLSVMLFHFNQGLVPGGFAGVDVFFVISGFLMTSIIFRGLENNNFSLWNFLKARARRIVPALVTVISIVLALGYLFFEPLTYQLAGKHGFSSLLFISNITYANESGYFDSDSFSKLFLHTWSLSVEWQFYIIYPIILLILSKLLSINTLKKVVVISAIISLSFCIYFSSINKTLSYFMIYTRGWEMLLGGIAFLFPLSTTENKKRIIESIGLVLIITSFFIFSDTDSWPSYNALIPVFGTYLCILANSYKSILSNKALQKIGLWSYSIYLVHWPLLVFFKTINIDISIFSYFSITILISYSIFNLIEKKRNYNYGLLLFYIFTSLSSYYISINGISSRLSGDKKNETDLVEYHRKFYGGEGISNKVGVIYKNNDSYNNLVIFGDSFSRQYGNYLNKQKMNYIGFFQDGCFSANGVYNVYDPKLKNECISRWVEFSKYIQIDKKSPIVLAQGWKSDLALKSNKDDTIAVKPYEFIDFQDKFIDEIVKISGEERNIYIIGRPTGVRKNIYQCLSENKLPIYKYINISPCKKPTLKRDIKINNHLKELSLKYKNVFFIDPNDILCNDELCMVVDKKGNPIYSDTAHLSIYGAEVVGEYIISKIK
ncbi:TPA: acyltransferase [Proteus mirabilis]|nr:acyltransferase [Proteus mirabilis]HAU5581041.1 acyltransferase [Proteus mirabilis]HAU5584888.1 acyltransferase [Proteus mirabilis]HEK0780198.1 acyltransferase [Proteus mirabilis]